MIAAQATARHYQKIQFQTVDRGQLLLLMFDGALRFLRQRTDASAYSTPSPTRVSISVAL